MGTKNKIKNVNNIVASKSSFSEKISEGWFPGMMEDFIDGDKDNLFNGKTLIGFSPIDSFCFNPKTGETLVANRFDNTHYEVIEENGESAIEDYILGYINFPGTLGDLPSGWMTEMMQERTISLRYEGSFESNDDYKRVMRTLNFLKKHAAPLDYKVIILFGESQRGRGGFLNDRPNGTIIKYNNLKDLEVIG